MFVPTTRASVLALLMDGPCPLVQCRRNEHLDYHLVWNCASFSNLVCSATGLQYRFRIHTKVDMETLFHQYEHELITSIQKLYWMKDVSCDPCHLADFHLDNTTASIRTHTTPFLDVAQSEPAVSMLADWKADSGKTLTFHHIPDVLCRLLLAIARFDETVSLDDVYSYVQHPFIP